MSRLFSFDREFASNIRQEHSECNQQQHESGASPIQTRKISFETNFDFYKQSRGYWKYGSLKSGTLREKIGSPCKERGKTGILEDPEPAGGR